MPSREVKANSLQCSVYRAFHDKLLYCGYVAIRFCGLLFIVRVWEFRSVHQICEEG